MDELIQLKNLLKHFNGTKAVDDISFELQKGTITVLIGPNGAGKTTVFNIINGFIRPDKGLVNYRGKDIVGLSVDKIANLGIGRLFQDIRLHKKLTVLENVLIANKNNIAESPVKAIFERHKVKTIEKDNLKKAIKWLEFVGLVDELNKSAENLSFGQQKLLCIARLLANDAELLLLDEPFTGVTEEVVIKQIIPLFKKFISEGKTILFIEHLLNMVWEVADTVILMDEGKIVDCGSSEEMKKSKLLTEVYCGN